MNDLDKEKTATYLNSLYFHDKRNGTFLQAGAYDGIGSSITYPFEKQLDWHGLLLQPNYRLIDSIYKHRQEDTILNVGLGDKTQVLDYQYLPSRADCGGFSLSSGQKDWLRKVGFDGRSQRQKVQVFAYQDLVTAFSIDKIDLAVIDVQGHEAKVLQNIVSSNVKPTFMVVEHLHSNKQQLLDIAAPKFDTVEELGANLIFHRRYTVLIVTRCTRPQNLVKMLEALNKVFKTSHFNFIWYAEEND